ncbi:MAG: hypothetical protein ACE5G7_02135 [Candidatus Hydrothermarchaeaceae archaeon]
MLRGYTTSERGSVPFTALGLVILLTATVGVYHFNKIDEMRVEHRTVRRADMETFYGLAQIAFDIQQIARMAAEDVLNRDSVGSYAEPINVDKWHDEGAYQAWSEGLKMEISEEVERSVINSYSQYERHHNEHLGIGSLEYDFSNFLGGKDGASVKVEVLPDEFDKGQRKMTLNISTEPSKYIGIRNTETGFSLTMRDDTLVGVDARPFTMAEEVYDFTGIFKRDSPNIWDFEASRDTVDEFAWYIWAAEEVLGLLEANLRHEVRFATDARVTYSLAHMIIAYKEKQHFDAYDYIHVAREVLRPWVGNEEGGKEFLGLLKSGIQSGYVDQAIGMMESGVLLGRLNSLSWNVNNNIIRVVARLDSSLVNGANFPVDYIPGGGFIPSRGAVQLLQTASDISSLSRTEGQLKDMRNSIADATGDPALYRSRWVGYLNYHRSVVDREYHEFVEDVDEAESSIGFALRDMGYVGDSLVEMEHALDESKCESMLASQLWYGSGGEAGDEGLKGLNEVFLVKRNDAEDISNSLTFLQEHIGVLRYQEDGDDIDETYEFASSDMRRALNALQGASAYRGYYYSCRESWSTSHSRPTSGCEESRIVEEDYDCGTEEEPATCTRTWTEYRCTCKGFYKRKYADRMSGASYALLSAIEEIESLKASITSWFDERGYEDVLEEISEVHGYKTGMGLMGFYYNHHRINPPHRSYVTAFEYALNLSEPKAKSNPGTALSYTVGDPVEEEFTDYGYGFIHTTFTGLYTAFNPRGASIRYDEAKAALKTMREDGFFEFLLELTTAISYLINYFGDILSLLIAMDRDYASFPMLKDHLYASFPLPPIGQSSKGFSLLHDIRIRADNHPAVLEFSLPLLGERRIELPPSNSQEGGKGYSIPIPFTPLNIYAWGFHITRSQVGSEPLNVEAVGEKSTLWLVDYENQGNLAPLATVRFDNESFPTPVYLHRSLMYKYEFTAGDYEGSRGGITKSFNSEKLPPVIIIALGPFTTNFRGWVEPPDAGEGHVAVDVVLEESSDGVIVAAKLSPELEVQKGGFLLRIYEVGNNEGSLLSQEIRGSLDEMPLELELEKTELSLPKTHGWSLVNVDLYALDEEVISLDAELLEHVIGEDHASLPLVDPALEVDVRITDYDGESIGILNNGNRRVEVGLASDDGCCFFKKRSNWERGLWAGSLGAGETRRIRIRPVGPVSLALKAEIPIEVQRLIQNATGMRFHDYYELR